MRLTASIKYRKKVCAYEKMCAYKKGVLNNPSLWYVIMCLIFTQARLFEKTVFVIYGINTKH